MRQRERLLLKTPPSPEKINAGSGRNHTTSLTSNTSRLATVLGLQRTHGNGFVQRFVQCQRVASGAQQDWNGVGSNSPSALEPAASHAAGRAPSALQRLAADETENLQSTKFAENPRLQKAFDNNPALHIGENGRAVQLVQEAVGEDGFPMPASTKPTGELDGQFGQETFAAIKQFQEKHGLEADGIVGRQTLRRLDQLAGGTPAPEVVESTQGTEVAGFQSTPDHYMWEIKAWIPFAQIPDPEEPLQEMRFRLGRSGDEVSDYHSQYRGDAHAGYAGSARVIHRVEFDWDGQAIANFSVSPLQHFGTTHREFSAVVKQLGSIARPRAIRSEETATTDRACPKVIPTPQSCAWGWRAPTH